ncbi:MAG: hypothetical protein ACRDJW_12830 [Thermomicrobiales bacterium]
MSTVLRRPMTKAQHETARWEKDADLHRRVVRDMIERPEAYDDIPNGCMLVLVPDDDEAQANWVIEQGVASARQGRNVYMRQVVVAELPPLPEPNPAAIAGMKRTFYNMDGSIHAVEVGREDGTWSPVDVSFGEPPYRSADESTP